MPPINFYSRPPVVDEYTILYLPFDSDFSDYSGLNHLTSASGNLQIDATESVFGGASARFDGTGDYLTITDNDNLYIANTDAMTIDFFVKFNSLPSASGTQFLYHYGDTSAHHWIAVDKPNDYYRFIFEVTRSSGNGANILANDISLTTNRWYRITITKPANAGTNTIFYLDGVAIGDAVINADIFGATYWVNLANDMYLGKRSDNVGYFDGWIDEFNISRIVRTPGGQAINFYGRTIYEAKTVYAPLSGNLAIAATVEDSADGVTPLPCQVVNASTYRRICVSRLSPPGSGNEIKCTLRKNYADTALTVSLIGDSTFNYADTDIDVSDFDLLDTKIEYIGSISYNTSSPLAISYLSQGSGGQTLFGSGMITFGASPTEFPANCNFNNGFNQIFGGTLFPQFHTYFPTAGSVVDFLVKSRVPETAANTFYWTVDAGTTANYASSALKVLTSVDGVSQNFRNDTNDLAILIDEMRCLYHTQAGGGPFHSLCSVFVPATPGNFIYQSFTGGLTTGNVTQYHPICGAIDVLAGSSGGESFNIIPYAGTFKRIQTFLEAAMGTNTFTITLRKNSVDTALTVSLTSASGRAAYTEADVSVDVGDRVSMKYTGYEGGGTSFTVSVLFESDDPSLFPIFYAEEGTGTLPATQQIQKPINFYSLP